MQADHNREKAESGPKTTLENIERLRAQIVEAEVNATRRIAQALRDAAVEIPFQSRLPMTFAQHAGLLARYADWHEERGRHEAGIVLSLYNMNRGIKRDLDDSTLPREDD